MADLARAASRALASLDLTDLDENCGEDDIDALIRRAQTPHGPVAAVCIWPRFVSRAKAGLAGSGVKVATVVNFPGGDRDAGEVQEMTRRAVADGADEIDLVIPYKAFLEGDEELVPARIGRVRRAAGPGVPVKAILETGALETTENIRRAAELAIEGGADFLKTSTGKVPVNATPRAARILLETIRDAGAPVGFKAAGGVRSTEEAAGYLALADEIVGEDWATPETFRFGASGLLDALLATLDGHEAPEAAKGY